MKKADLTKEYNKLVYDNGILRTKVEALEKNQISYQIINEIDKLKKDLAKVIEEKDTLLKIVNENPGNKEYLELKKERDILYDIFKITQENLNELCNYSIGGDPEDLLKGLEGDFCDIKNEMYNLREKCEKMESKLDRIRSVSKMDNWSD